MPASRVLGPPIPRTADVLADLKLARRFAARQVVFDGLEYLEAGPRHHPPAWLVPSFWACE